MKNGTERSVKTIALKNGAELIIRPAQEADAEQLVLFKKAIAPESDFLSYGENELELTPKAERLRIRADLASGNSETLLAVISGELAGFSSFHGGARARKRHSGEMGIAVREKYWGLGIGSCLIEALVDWAKGGKIVRKINLLTRSDNAKAIALYEKYGFRKEGVLTRDLCIRGEFHDALLMGLPID